jgi:uncharacterized membrane protein YbaN (DUF454 family)
MTASLATEGLTMTRGALLIAGWFCVSLAVVGAILPLVPCTPFLLLATACFARSSTRTMNRLRRSPLLGPVLRDWQRHRGIRPATRLTAVAVALAAPLISLAWYQELSLPFFGSLAGCLVAIVFVCRLPSIPSIDPAKLRLAA